MEMSWCFSDARDDPVVGVIILTGEFKVTSYRGWDGAPTVGTVLTLSSVPSSSQVMSWTCS